MNTPNLDRFSRPGPYEYKYQSPSTEYVNTCDICDEYEAVVIVGGTKHCEECASEIEVVVL